MKPIDKTKELLNTSEEKPRCTEKNRPLISCDIRWYDNGECYCADCDYVN